MASRNQRVSRMKWRALQAFDRSDAFSRRDAEDTGRLAIIRALCYLTSKYPRIWGGFAVP
jgi:hypothetical protein